MTITSVFALLDSLFTSIKVLDGWFWDFVAWRLDQQRQARKDSMVVGTQNLIDAKTEDDVDAALISIIRGSR